MKFRTEVNLDGTQESGETGKIMIATADGSIFFIEEAFVSKRLIIASNTKPLSIEPINKTSVYIDVKKE